MPVRSRMCAATLVGVGVLIKSPRGVVPYEVWRLFIAHTNKRVCVVPSVRRVSLVTQTNRAFASCAVCVWQVVDGQPLIVVAVGSCVPRCSVLSPTLPLARILRAAVWPPGLLSCSLCSIAGLVACEWASAVVCCTPSKASASKRQNHPCRLLDASLQLVTSRSHSAPSPRGAPRAPRTLGAVAGVRGQNGRRVPPPGPQVCRYAAPQHTCVALTGIPAVECSGLGSCVRFPQQCTSSDPMCTASCQCGSTAAGSACSVAREDLPDRAEVRGKLIATMAQSIDTSKWQVVLGLRGMSLLGCWIRCAWQPCMAAMATIRRRRRHDIGNHGVLGMAKLVRRECHCVDTYAG